MLRFLLALAAFFGFTSVYGQQFLSTFNDISALAKIDGKVCFAADDGIYGNELWISDGTVQGTKLLKDIEPGTGGSDPADFITHNGELYFTATTLQYGTELWKTDGTAAGTALVKDVRTGHTLGSNPGYLGVFKGNLYFTASSDGFNTFLYKTNGSAAGTIEVKLLGFGDVSDLTATNSYLYVVFNETLWRSDGTTPGTVKVDADAQPIVRNLEAAGDRLFFSTSSSSGSTVRLYTIEGNNPPAALKSFNAPAGATNLLANLMIVNNRLFFSVSRDFDTESDELWISDGTAAGTMPVKAFGWLPPDPSTAMKNFVSFNNNLYFQTGNSEGYSLWKSDATAGGTVQVSDVQVGYPYQEENRPVVADGSLYFSGNGELWKSDGTSAGTRQLFDINQGQVSVPTFITGAGGKVYFAADDGYGISLWNNTPAAELDVQSESGSVLSGDMLVFDPVQVDGCAVKILEIVNPGIRELVLSEVAIAGQDFLIRGELPEIINPGERFSFEVYFLPLYAGPRSGQISIRTSDANESNFVLKVNGEAVGGDSPAFCDVFTDSLTRQLLPVGEADIVISNASIPEKKPAGSVVGTVSVAQTSGIFSYTLVAGAGDADNALFQLAGGVLRTAAPLDYRQRSVYTIRVQADGDAGQYESVLTIQVTRAVNTTLSDCDPEIIRLNLAIRDIEFNSQGDLFAACENGILMRSSNNGTTWSKLESGVRDPLDKVQFRGTSGYITGDGFLLKSDDNGATWFRMFLPYDVFVQATFFVDENVGYATGINGELLHTSDGGRHWDLRGNPFFISPSALWFWDENNGIVCDELGGVMKTFDGGLTWYVVDTGLIGNFNPYVGLAFANANSGLLVSYTNLYKSDDGGESWYPVSGISGENFTEVAFAGAGTAYVTGGFSSNEVWMSTNGGVSWSNVDADPVTATTGIAYRSSSNLVVLSGTNSSNPGAIEPGSAIVSAPAGTSGWDIRSELRSQDFYAVEFPSGNVGYAFGEFNSYKTTDGGLSWKAMALASVVTGSQFTDEQKGFVADGYNVYKTTNGGSSFTPSYSVDVNGSANLRKLLAVTQDVILAYSSFGTIYRTANTGTSWSLVYDQPLNQLMEVTFPTNQVGYGVDLLGKVIKTTNGGTSWSTVYTWAGSGEFFNTIAFVSATVGFMGGKDGLLLKTTDGGASWVPVFGGIPSTIKNLVFATAQEGYAFLEEGTVYKTNDGGAAWTWLGNLSYIGLSDIDVAGGKIFYCGHYGNLGKIDVRPGAVQPGYVSGPEEVCVDDKVTFEVAGSVGLEYLWSVPGASLTAAGNTAVVTFENSGEYVLTVSSLGSCGASASRTLSVTVSGPPSPVIAGPTLVASNSEEEYVIEDARDNSRYTWNVSGASSYSQEGEIVTITWGTDPGVVRVMEIDEVSGCRAVNELAVEVEITTVVGIGDGSILDAGVTVYPNPTLDYLYIESSLSSELHLRVYDLSGKEFGRQSVNPHDSGMFNLSVLPRGIYIIEISAKGLKEKSVKRLVKK